MRSFSSTSLTESAKEAKTVANKQVNNEKIDLIDRYESYKSSQLGENRYTKFHCAGKKFRVSKLPPVSNKFRQKVFQRLVEDRQKNKKKFERKEGVIVSLVKNAFVQAKNEKELHMGSLRIENTFLKNIIARHEKKPIAQPTNESKNINIINEGDKKII